MPTDQVQPEDIRLLCLDVDGVLTDGSILLNDHGHETKRFFAQDGIAIKAWLGCGRHLGVITARDSPSTTYRMRELGVTHLYAGVQDKGTAFETLLAKVNVNAAQAAMVGDDLPDLPILRRCGYPIAVENAVAEVRAAACLVTTASGGRGAVREVVEHLLKAQGRWDDVVSMYDYDKT
jgi:3-deoxy-D-manno-octulosonate 8-phosphate phosphatase (KDO 8-P phosphatase)